MLHKMPQSKKSDWVALKRESVMTASQKAETSLGHHVVALPNEKSSLFGAVSNMVNFIVGAGMYVVFWGVQQGDVFFVGIPYAISNAGLVAGVSLLLLVCAMMDKTLRMMVELATYHPKLRTLGICSYEGLARIPFGRTGSFCVLGGMLVMAYGAMLAYLLIIKDTVPAILGLTSEAGHGSFMHSEFPMLVTSLVIVVPLSMMRDLASLDKMSLLSALAAVTLVGFVVFCSPVHSAVGDAGGFGQVLTDNVINSRIFIGLGVLSTAMACQHGAFIVSNSLRDLTPRRWGLVSSSSIAISGALCLLIGVAGYLGFLDETQGVILNNFDADSMIANAGRGLLAVTMFFTYPTKAFVARHVLVELLYDGDLDGNDKETQFGKYFGRRHKVVLAIYIATLVPALLVDDMGPVLSITGAVGTSLLAYVGVGMVYLGVNGEDFLSYCLGKVAESHGLELVSTTNVDADKNGSDTQKDTDILSHCQKMLNDHQHQHEKQKQSQIPIATSEVDIPCDGSTSSSTGALSSEQSIPMTEEILSLMRKPWWWYLCGFPIWTAIASSGAKGMRNYLLECAVTEGLDRSDNAIGVELGVDAAKMDYSKSLEQETPSRNITIGPCTKDYYVCMFLIIFGTMAAVVGLASNIYVGITECLSKPI